MKKKSVAVVGLGWFGRAHARNYQNLANLVAVCDQNPNVARDYANRNDGVNHYTSVEDMISNESIDAASVVTPPSAIPGIAGKLAAAGVDVLIEKPLGLELPQVEKLREYPDVRVMPGFIELFNPVIDDLDALVAAGEVGEVLTVSSTRIGLHPRRYWGMGVVLDLGIHDVYLHQHLLGEVTSVAGEVRHYHSGEFEDAAFILLGFGESKSMIESNWLTPSKFRKMLVAGSEGSIEIDFVTKALRVIKGRDLESDHPATIETTHTPLRPEEPLAREITNFLYDDEPKVTLEQGIAALRVALQVLGK
ncbi:MAG: Gfo/Idh/MocA family protein [Promethearchaeota archaeon]